MIRRTVPANGDPVEFHPPRSAPGSKPELYTLPPVCDGPVRGRCGFRPRPRVLGDENDRECFRCSPLPKAPRPPAECERPPGFVPVHWDDRIDPRLVVVRVPRVVIELEVGVPA